MSEIEQHKCELPMAVETSGPLNGLGSVAVSGVCGDNERPPTEHEKQMAWKQIEDNYSPQQVALLRRFSKSGTKGFHIVKSAEAAPAGAIKDNPSRFKPSRSTTP